MSKITDIGRWRVEIELAEKFRNDEFGEYSRKTASRAGLNIDYYERGYAGEGVEAGITTLNLFHAIVKNIVPALGFRNPRVLSLPKKVEAQDTAPVVGETVNHYYKKLEAELTNYMVIWDAYTLGYGVSKIGYATKFGADIKDEKKRKTIVDKVLEKVGLKKGTEEDVTRPEVNMNIVSESPYISYVSPFNFGMDPRARSIHEAMYVYEKFEKTVKQMKENPKYKNTDQLRGSEPDLAGLNGSGISQSEIEDFRTLDVYEIHYRSGGKFYILVISEDGEYREHYHEESIYEIDGWQYEMLDFNKHGHKLFPLSDMTKIRSLQDRFNNTIDAILEQVDRFEPKIGYHETEVTEQGKSNLINGGLGALVGTTKNPSEVFKEISFTQFKNDLKMLLDQLIDLITIQTGLTRAQLTGVSSSGTATEASIEQGGQTLRLEDMNNNVRRYMRRQASKLWQVIKQFVELEELELINGINGMDEKTGLPKYSWLTISPEQSEKMQISEYDFDIEVGSTEKPNLPVIRKQFENLFNILARTDVIVLMQQQGKKVDLAELLRQYIALFPEMTKDIGRIIQNITPQTTGLVPPPTPSGGGTTSGSANNALQSQQAQPAPTAGVGLGGFS